MAEINIHQSTPQINIDTATRTYHLPIASETTLGGIKVGNNLTIEDDGTLNAEQTSYQLPTASALTLGGVKVGDSLTISNGVLNAKVDSSLSASSSNPVENSVINSSVTTLTSGLQAANTNIGTLQTNLGTLSNTVSGHTTSISDLNTTVSAHTTAIETNTDNISNNTSAISDLSTAVGGIDDRLTTAEGTITDQGNSINELGGNINALLISTDTDITYSYLLPVSTWTAGSLTIHRRGKVGYIDFNVTGNYTLGSTPILLYTLETLPLQESRTILLSDGGAIIASVNTSGEIYLENISGSNITLTTLQGQLTIFY